MKRIRELDRFDEQLLLHIKQSIEELNEAKRMKNNCRLRYEINDNEFNNLIDYIYSLYFKLVKYMQSH